MQMLYRNLSILLRYSPRLTKGVINCVDNVLFNSIVSSTRILLNVNKELMLLRTSHRLCIGQHCCSRNVSMHFSL